MSAERSCSRVETPFSPIPVVLEELRQGHLIVLVDDESRENEGDLVCPAQATTPDKINFMLRHGRGTLCVARSAALCRHVPLRPQAPVNPTPFDPGLPVTVDAGPQLGVTTGVSAVDRAPTIRHLVAEEAVPEDFVRPGHVNPLIARDGGVLVRNGQTEGSVALFPLAGLMTGAALIAILNDDGARAPGP